MWNPPSRAASGAGHSATVPAAPQAKREHERLAAGVPRRLLLRTAPNPNWLGRVGDKPAIEHQRPAAYRAPPLTPAGPDSSSFRALPPPRSRCSSTQPRWSLCIPSARRTAPIRVDGFGQQGSASDPGRALERTARRGSIAAVVVAGRRGGEPLGVWGVCRPRTSPSAANHARRQGPCSPLSVARLKGSSARRRRRRSRPLPLPCRQRQGPPRRGQVGLPHLRASAIATCSQSLDRTNATQRAGGQPPRPQPPRRHNRPTRRLAHRTIPLDVARSTSADRAAAPVASSWLTPGTPHRRPA